jgi:hypothetical protein
LHKNTHDIIASLKHELTQVNSCYLLKNYLYFGGKGKENIIYCYDLSNFQENSYIKNSLRGKEIMDISSYDDYYLYILLNDGYVQIVN